MTFRPHPLFLVLIGLAMLTGVGLLGQRWMPMLSPQQAIAEGLRTPVDLPGLGLSLTRTPEACLTLAMYWEAKGEGVVGMAAVGAVVMNRTGSRLFPNDVCAVVTQGGEGGPCQFSFWCDGRSDRPVERTPWQNARKLAQVLLAGRLTDPSEGALYFHAGHVSPYWMTAFEPTVRIRNHFFYR
ncbi:cell wall hydrolase [Marinivivus vitaminiproducens]|uniref:cell wall hydrolase n=1 Tax=Marinivivus vitaminiproducens TaxID=3035935 RepID=UPI0027A9D4B7|nr:cell wall hydrolase [Geminicoccaceae bacterium SCSIO 64248]